MKFKDYAVTSLAAPLQIEGQLEDGRYFYFRSRGNAISVSLSEVSVDDAVGRGLEGERVLFVVQTPTDDPFITSWLPEEDGHALVPIMIRLWDSHELTKEAGPSDLVKAITGTEDGTEREAADTQQD